MSQLIAESVIAQTAPLMPWLTDGVNMAKFMITNSFLVVGSAFATLFMIMVLRVFVKGMSGLDWTELFRGDVKKEISLTKFWTNIAYFTATVAFIGKIFLSQGTSDSQNMLWLIYLGGVGSNAIAAKWLGLKYAIAYQQAGGTGPLPDPTPAPVVTTTTTTVAPKS